MVNVGSRDRPGKHGLMEIPGRHTPHHPSIRWMMHPSIEGIPGKHTVPGAQYAVLNLNSPFERVGCEAAGV